MSHGKWLIPLILAVASSVVLRLIIIHSKATYLQDEGASLILITGHLSDYDGVMYDNHFPARAWVPAQEWKKFLTLNRPVSFRKIATDAARSDFHPPLFYWLLYWWYRLWGVDPWTGSWFCVLLAAFTALALFGFAHELLKDRQAAAAVTLIWAASPAVIVISEQARQYELFGLCTVLLAWAVVRGADPRRPFRGREFLAFVLTTTAGVLTHYHFLFVVFAAGLYSAFALARSKIRRMLTHHLALAAGCLGLPLWHPLFYDSFQRGLDKARGFEIMERGLAKPDGLPVLESLGRGAKTLWSLFAFFLDPLDSQLLFGQSPGSVIIIRRGILVGFLMLLALAPWLRLKSSGNRSLPARGGGPAVFFLLVIGGLIALFYVVGISPSQAMGTRYLAPVWVFFAFLPVLYFLRFSPGGQEPALIFGLVMLVSGGLTAETKYAESRQKPALDLRAETADLLVVDTLSRTQLPGIIYLAPDNLPVFAAYQDDLLARPAAWLPRLQGRVVYVSRSFFQGNRPEKTREILEMIQNHRRVKSLIHLKAGVFVLDIAP